MKIRTDFVTNSSSSSFILEIRLTDVDGNEYSHQFRNEDREGAAELNCDPQDILKASNLDELFDVIWNGISYGDDDDYYDDDDDDCEDDDDYYEESCDVPAEFAALRSKSSKTIKNLGDLKSVRLSKIWEAWGEAASCFSEYMFDNCDDEFLEKLNELTDQIHETSGSEKQAAVENLIKHLESHDIGTLEGGAEKFSTADKYSLDDDAVESVTVDLQEKVINAEAKYFLRENR